MKAPRIPISRRLAVVAVLCAPALHGCAGTGESATRFYVLSPLPAAAPAVSGAGAGDLAVDIGALRLPQYLDRAQIVTRASDSQVRLAENDLWGGNLEKDMMRVLAQNLSRLLVTPEVTVLSRRAPRATDVRVEIEVLQFERGPDDRVQLAVRWRLRGGGRGDAPGTRLTEIASAALPDDAGMEATVAAMSAVWGEFSRIVASAIAQTLPATAGRG